MTEPMTLPTSARRAPPRRCPPPAAGGVGASPLRPDGTLKVTGEFAYASDLWMDDMIWGVTLRSPHPYARISSIDIGEALATAGRATPCSPHEDVPGAQRATAWSIADQPVLAVDVVRYQGEPVALVAADHPEIARRAAKKIVVDYEVARRRSPTPSAAARRRTAPRAAPAAATWCATSRSARATRRRRADVVVDRRLRGRHAGPGLPRPGVRAWPCPTSDGGVDLYVATQWLHVDQRQICAGARPAAGARSG